MPIQILRDEERLVYENAGSKIFYRRVSTYRRGLIMKRHTKRGQVDYIAVTRELMEYAILGWEGVERNGKAVPFDPELIPNLPEEDSQAILELCGASDISGSEASEETLKKN